MSQPTTDDNQNLMDNFDFILENNGLRTLTEGNNSLSQQSGHEIEGRYEIETEDMNMILFPEQLFREVFGDSQSPDSYSLLSPDMDSMENFLIQTNEVLPSTESNDIDEPIQSATDEQLAMIRTGNSSLPINRSQNEKSITKISSDQSINLSRSVAVTNPTPKSLQLKHPLEDTYRPRYKSDYFPSKGSVRRPRYVADNAGHHYITLQMPTEYPRDLKTEFVRVALLTVSFDGKEHFYSPYKFQQDHHDVKIPDENPIYLPVEEMDGIMRIHLVLIKSKLDQLNTAQPLIQFSSTNTAVQNIIPQGKLAPKDLISKYQLDKSHIAFTLCSKLSDGSYEIHSETTTISSVIAEMPNKPSSSAVNNQSEETVVNTSQRVSCPHCSHCFDINEGEIKKQNGKKRSSNAKSLINQRSNKKQKLI